MRTLILIIWGIWLGALAHSFWASYTCLQKQEVVLLGKSFLCSGEQK